MSSVHAPVRHSPWLAVAGVCGVYFSFGMTLGVMAPLVDEISADLELSRATMGSILGAWSLIYVFTAVPAGAIVDRLGLRWSLTFGGLAIAGSLLLRSLSSGAFSLFLAVAVFGIGGPLVSIATPKLVASLFDEDARRLPTGLAVSAPGVGSAVALAITSPVLLPAVDDSWRAVLIIMAVVSIVATGLWLFASRAVAHVPSSSPKADRQTVRQLLALPSMRRILVVSLFSFFFALALTSWLPEILSDAGQSENVAGYLSALSVAAGLAGSLVLARLVPSAHRGTALMVIFAVLAILALGLTTLPIVPLVVALAVLGFTRAGLIPMLFLEIMGDPDIKLADIGAATGLFFAVGEIGGFVGPYAVGFVADRAGFGAATVLLAGAAGLGVIAAWRLRQVSQTVPVAQAQVAKT